jgi:hypothetical protein
MNPYLKRLEKSGSSGHGKKSEKRVAKSLAARLTPASGALRGAKGDFKTEVYLCEAKSTVKTSLPIELAWMVKISVEALNTGRVPAVALSFVTPDGSAKAYGDWVAIPKHEFQRLTEDR